MIIPHKSFKTLNNSFLSWVISLIRISNECTDSTKTSWRRHKKDKRRKKRKRKKRKAAPLNKQICPYCYTTRFKCQIWWAEMNILAINFFLKKRQIFTTSPKSSQISHDMFVFLVLICTEASLWWTIISSFHFNTVQTSYSNNHTPIHKNRMSQNQNQLRFLISQYCGTTRHTTLMSLNTVQQKG